MVECKVIAYIEVKLMHGNYTPGIPTREGKARKVINVGTYNTRPLHVQVYIKVLT